MLPVFLQKKLLFLNGRVVIDGTALLHYVMREKESQSLQQRGRTRESMGLEPSRRYIALV
jgi:hypothetical protein